MSKAVMLSIRPKWVEEICNGEKTIEVRKTRPKLETPFKCYIYCTKKNDGLIKGDIPTTVGYIAKNEGKVIGEFVCDEIISIAGAGRISSDIARPTCIEPAELHRYLGAANGYGWHISDLRIYDQPREFTEFRKSCPNDLYCEDCAMYSNNNGICNNGALPLRRPPQSWCYVQEG